MPAKGGARSYKLLLEAMRDTGKVAIGRIVLRSREQLVSIRPRGDALMMVTMNFAHEIHETTSFYELEETDIEVSARELEMARRLIDSIAQPFEIDRYRNTWYEAVMDLIDRKANGEQIVLEPPPKDERLQAPDLMSALEASLEEVRARTGTDNGESPGESSPTRKRSKTAAAAGNGKQPRSRNSAPTGRSAPPTGRSAPPTGRSAPPTGRSAPPTGRSAPPTGRSGPPTGRSSSPAGKAAPTGRTAPPGSAAKKTTPAAKSRSKQPQRG